MTGNPIVILGMVLAAGLAAGCSGIVVENKPDEIMTPEERRKSDFGKLFGEDIMLYGGVERDDAVRSPIAVNAFLWRAALDTLSFMPLASADSFGGVIITDWHAPPEAPDERFKATVYILSRDLRADGIRVAVFRQRREDSGTWSDAAISPETAFEIENAILARARELRVASVPQ